MLSCSLRSCSVLPANFHYGILISFSILFFLDILTIFLSEFPLRCVQPVQRGVTQFAAPYAMATCSLAFLVVVMFYSRFQDFLILRFNFLCSFIFRVFEVIISSLSLSETSVLKPSIICQLSLLAVGDKFSNKFEQLTFSSIKCFYKVFNLNQILNQLLTLKHLLNFIK